MQCQKGCGCSFKADRPKKVDAAIFLPGVRKRSLRSGSFTSALLRNFDHFLNKKRLRAWFLRFFGLKKLIMSYIY